MGHRSEGTFWQSPEWERYEKAYGDEPGTRARLLAESDFQTRIVDLSLPEEQLWRGVRKSYRPVINGLKKDPDFSMVAVVGEGRAFDDCRALHVREAGRETRPLETWRIQADWLNDGGAFAMGAVRNGNLKGFAYVVTFDTWAYYFSAASSEPNVQHAIQWQAMNLLKQSGRFRWYELGWMEPDDSRAFFKRGFGGKDVPASWSGRALSQEEWGQC